MLREMISAFNRSVKKTRTHDANSSLFTMTGIAYRRRYNARFPTYVKDLIA